MIYYVYRHIRNDTGLPFYVGKGKCDRATSKKNRNKHWHHIVESVGYRIEIVVADLDEELAFLCECELIAMYRYLKYELVNYTDGGEGPSGYRHTDETLQKMRRPRTFPNGINPRLGVPLSSEHKAKLSAAKIGKPGVNKGRVQTEEHRKNLSIAHMGKLADTYWWNNSVNNTRSKSCPGPGWVRGRVKRGE